MICSTTGAQLVAALCTPRLLDQFNQTAKSHHLRLLEELRVLVFHFRFMDLPPELRNKVYDCLIPARSMCVVFLRSSTTSRHRQMAGYPAITSISRQVRSESLPLFYSRCYFAFRFAANIILPESQCNKIERNANIAEHVRSWAECLSTIHLKHLRKVTLLFRIKGSSTTRMVWVGFDAKQGFRFQVPDRHKLKQKSMEMLEKYGEEVDRSRKMLGLQGESIIMAITGKDEMWKFGTLTC